MATTNLELPSHRPDSPSPDASLVPALGACPELSRCLSTASSVSQGSSTDVTSRDSFGSDASSRQSSGSYATRRSESSSASRQSTCSSTDGRPSRRRGYMRPAATGFAASARSRESVMNLGSIAHLQYYFARTGLLDGKGGQLARKNKQQQGALDMSMLGSPTLSPKIVGTDVDTPEGSLGSSPDLNDAHFEAGQMVESPVEAQADYGFDDYDEPDPAMLPPTASTYVNREKPVPKPPTIDELKTELTATLHDAARSLAEAKSRKISNPEPNTTAPQDAPSPEENTQGWYELQGMHILDVMTLAIRAAKVYYTSHEHPDRLDTIKSEKEVRSELLSVMEVLKHMGTRGFTGGMRDDEIATMDGWIEGVFAMLRREEEIAQAERDERASWTWLDGDWTGREIERELAFMASMDVEAEPLPPYTPATGASELPTPFLQSMQNGLRLVKLHNAAVQRSRRRFGAIPTFHTDTQKPYRCADNLRYWVKAAELRWEVVLRLDALAVVYNNRPEAWAEFEVAIWAWCRKVREEIAGEIQG